MNTFDALKNISLDHLDPDEGVLSVTLSWQLLSKDPHPEYLGKKLSTLTYLPIQAEDPCPCGNGKPFVACCQRLPYWRPVCPNPAMQGYSLLRPQSALFSQIPDDEVYAFLHSDERLHCVDDDPQDAMWLYWGNPAFTSPTYSIYCFGDFALKKNHTLEITALSDARMQVLLELVRPLELGIPHMKREPAPLVEKSIRKLRQSKHHRK